MQHKANFNKKTQIESGNHKNCTTQKNEKNINNNNTEYDVT